MATLTLEASLSLSLSLSLSFFFFLFISFILFHVFIIFIYLTMAYLIATLTSEASHFFSFFPFWFGNLDTTYFYYINNIYPYYKPFRLQ